MSVPGIKETVTVIAAAVSSLALAASAGAAAPKCNGSAKLCDRTLSQVVFPGSHNAMSSADLKWGAPNQKLSIPNQLGRGIRAMLIDVHWGIPGTFTFRGKKRPIIKTADDGGAGRAPYLCHQSCEMGATKLATGLGWFKSFLASHPREVIVLDVENYVGAEQFAATAASAGLTKYIWNGATQPWPTLRQIIAAKRRIVVLTEDATSSIDWFHPAYSGLMQETPYSFATATELTDPASLAGSCRANRGGTTGSIFLMNHFVTPAGLGVPVVADSRLVNTRAAIVARARACQAARGMLPTIIAVNNVEVGGVVAAAKELNGV